MNREREGGGGWALVLFPLPSLPRRTGMRRQELKSDAQNYYCRICTVGLSILTLSIDICQWAIFALRNLLENNPENQNFVWWLDRQGLADTSRLRQFGVEAVEKDNGRIELIPLTPPKQQ